MDAKDGVSMGFADLLYASNLKWQLRQITDRIALYINVLHHSWFTLRIQFLFLFSIPVSLFNTSEISSSLDRVPNL